MPMGRVQFGGIQKEVCLSFLPEIEVGEYLIVHAGFAISQVDEAEAALTLELLRQMGELDAIR
jgi:hydrogenase expression/formation protein HypC